MDRQARRKKTPSQPEVYLSQPLIDACELVGDYGAILQRNCNCSPHDHRIATGLHLLDSMQVAHSGRLVNLHVPGTNLQSVTGIRRRPLAPQRALEMALTSALDVYVRPDEVYVRRHLAVSRDRSHQQVHMVRVEPPSIRTLRRSMHHLIGGEHADEDQFGVRYPGLAGTPDEVMLYVPYLQLPRLARDYATIVERGDLVLHPIDLRTWPR